VVQFPHLLAQYLYFRHWTKAVINSNRREGLLRAHTVSSSIVLRALAAKKYQVVSCSGTAFELVFRSFALCLNNPHFLILPHFQNPEVLYSAFYPKAAMIC
jgi:hypothetical protein